PDRREDRRQGAALGGGRRLADLGLAPLAPDRSWLGQMVAAELPDCDVDRLKSRLYEEHRVEIPVQRWQGRPLHRASFQGSNDEADLEILVAALETQLG